MEVYISKRYPGNRYEYLVSVVYEITSPRINQQRKLDIFKLFKKGNQMIADKNNNQSLVGPLFSQMNIPSQWFWSKNSISISENNTHMSNDHITNIISYIAPFPFNARLYAEFDTQHEKAYKICTLGDCKIFRESSDDSNKKQLIDKNPYASYYLFKLPPGKRLVFSAETEFSTPYVSKSEYDIDAQLEIKEIILFDVVDTTQQLCNPEQTYIYSNLEIERKSVTNIFTKSSNTCVKFRRPHVLPILPSINDAPHIYEYMQITKDNYNNYYKRIQTEDLLNHDIADKNISVTFSIIGSSIYTTKFLHDALSNLRRNIAHYSNIFNDIEFIRDVISQLIKKLENSTIRHQYDH